jgi:hypothetical protein
MLKREEAVFGIQQVADSLSSDGSVERSEDEETTGHRLARGQSKTGSDTFLFNLETGHAGSDQEPDLAGGGGAGGTGDARRIVSHQMKHQAENPLREAGGDGEGQGENSDEYERFHGRVIGTSRRKCSGVVMV